MSINNFSSRTLTENTALVYDYPWIKINGPLELDGPITGDGLPSLVSYSRYVGLTAVLAANTTLFYNFTTGTIDTTRWKVIPLTLQPYTTQSNFVVNTAGLYFLHFMTTYVVNPGNGQSYGTELVYYPGGGPGEVISSSMIERQTASFDNVVNTRTYFRYFAVGDQFTFRLRNSENNTCAIRLNVAFFAL